MAMQSIKVSVMTDYPQRFEEGTRLYDQQGFIIGYAEGVLNDEGEWK